jgi:CheY-like chemotaxis protein
MSHELRTPLNSLLILSDQLSKNADGNLNVKQVDFARTIHSSGNDLLTLINDILDLSKIESGTVVVDIADVPFRDLHDYVDRTFRHVAEQKKLEFEVSVAPAVPRVISTDAKRLQQILKNLLSNAFKFTERGGVSLEIATASDGWNRDSDTLNRARHVVALTVRDTGIGIPPEKQQIIFEAFQQADGSTSRKYGGTGLGLAISREIAGLLGGEIKLASIPGAGSTFTLYLPQTYSEPRGRRIVASTQVTAAATTAQLDDGSAPRGLLDFDPSGSPLQETESAMSNSSDDGAYGEPTSVASVNPFADDVAMLDVGDRVLLIIENDPHFVTSLRDVAHENNFKVLIAPRGAAALHLARERRPDAITLDINLPDIDGWRILSRLKDDEATRHIPVQVITTDEEAERALRLGAIGVLTKPIKTQETLDETFRGIDAYLARRTRGLLVVEADPARRQVLVDAVGGDDVDSVQVESGEAALAALADRTFDVIVIGIDCPDRKGLDLIDEIRERPDMREVPIILYSDRELSKREETHVKRLTQTSVLKDVRSPERLIDEVSLFLHRRVDQMPDGRRQMLQQLHRADAVLANKKVLIVDDDIRNIFAMTSLLEPHQMNILSAETGKDAIGTLQNDAEIDIVLMDIMMPDMDGYDTMRAIRKLGKFRSLPIIALTAKAMKGDREKCIEAGASDYISKPVDTEQLLAMLRVWLYR